MGRILDVARVASEEAGPLSAMNTKPEAVKLDCTGVTESEEPGLKTSVRPIAAEGAEDEPEAHMTRVAWKLITTKPYLPGTISWLETGNPSLYAELTRDLPNQIEQMWSQDAPLDEFQAALEQFVAAHDRACSEFALALLLAP